MPKQYLCQKKSLIQFHFQDLVSGNVIGWVKMTLMWHHTELHYIFVHNISEKGSYNKTYFYNKKNKQKTLK
jgi:hypothetical protein